MTNSSLAVAAARIVARLPPVRDWRAARYERRFAHASGNVRLFRGLYPSFAAAAASIPPTRPLGYDNLDSARRLEHERHRIVFSDYPVLFWLARLLPRCPRVFDLGGNVGISYHGFRRLLDFPPQLDWLVQDVPAVVARGLAILDHEPAPGLRYTSALTELAEADILLAAGVLHFLPDPIGFLRATPALPRHVILNKLPLHDRKSAWTVEAMGTAFSPYWLANRAELVAALEQRGYRCVDDWTIPEMRCDIPFHSEYSINAYAGFYFARPD